MNPRNKLFCLALVTAVAFSTGTPWLSAVDQAGSTQLRAVLLSAEQATTHQLDAAKSEGMEAVVLELKDLSTKDAESKGAAARRIQRAGLELYYWVEIGRNPFMAEAHPAWMASLQGHPEWRRFFKETPLPK